ncbi:SDR family NAD(P)-dependent oxidoreductase [Alteromonas oceanisediminis]|uniref:SDR family NAD(P)-dependent oxidoreductase n=1 Tax=Alteromonas oceanisediminis TaxID=2836180 RepID=UPI001BD9B93A|nr:SDR family NAD(P)-dependent oxidoreductase [Alteromonas oceanisediminis]MBT0586522.1 SDR family NAD(P)-dependent oxidoreductase [Alteromonas oceanisediminis]
MKIDSTMTAVVTGGCSGLGHATAVRLRESGFNVAIFDMNAEVGAQRVSELGEESTLFCQVDVRDAQAVEAAFAQVEERFGNLRVCVNCAGIAPAKRVLSREGDPMPLDSFSSVIDINLVGTFNVARVAASYMAKHPTLGEAQERGLIVNTASVAGYEGQIGQAAYAASKGGIIALSLPLARDLAKVGVRVNAIAPGIMGTPMLLAMPDNVQDALKANVPFPDRLGLPSEFASLVVHMIENAYLNGETIRLDGALRMPSK